MNLNDIIENLPKIKDIIKERQLEITKLTDIIFNLDKQLNIIEKQIKMILDVNLMDSSVIEKFSSLVESIPNIIKEQNKCIFDIVGLKEKISQLEQLDRAYPTGWKGGKVPGDIVETEDGCRVIYDGQSRSFKYKNIINSPKMFACEDMNDCKSKAEKYLYDYYNGLNKIVNKYRYVNYNTIEIQLSQDKTFITDSKFVELINNHRIGLKHDKRYDKYYITWISAPKVHKSFTELAFGISRAKISNGCDFDLRESNVVSTDNIDLIESDENKNQEQIKLNEDGLEMYKWIRGKYAGTVFQRTGELKWSVVVKKPDGHVVTKTLPFTEETKEKIHKEAIEIRNGLSNYFNLTTNKIRIIDGNKIEVKLSKDQIMTTDYKFMNVVEKYHIYVTKSSNENSKYYASFEANGNTHKYHKFITGWKMVDHIDRNPLNNCLSNLRETTSKLNNNNRSKSDTSNAIELGVTYSVKDNAYKARIKQDGKEISKQFSIKKYGKNEALRLAIESRKDFNHTYNCLNG